MYELIKKSIPSSLEELYHKNQNLKDDIEIFTENLIIQCMHSILSSDKIHPLKVINDKFGIKYSHGKPRYSSQN